MEHVETVSEKDNPPTVSVVVLSYNRPEYTDTTLRALTSIPSGVPHELIVVDNGSDATTVKMLETWRSNGSIDRLLLLPENLGTSPGFNRGFAIADTRSCFLTKLDNDIGISLPGMDAKPHPLFTLLLERFHQVGVQCGGACTGVDLGLDVVDAKFGE